MQQCGDRGHGSVGNVDVPVREQRCRVARNGNVEVRGATVEPNNGMSMQHGEGEKRLVVQCG